MRNWIVKWFTKEENLFNGLKKPIDLTDVSDAGVAEYSMWARELKSNAVWQDAIIALKYEYQREIVNKVQTKKQLQIARSYLKVLDELELFVEQATREGEIRQQMKGRNATQYLPAKS